jgi:hypothetical protein
VGHFLARLSSQKKLLREKEDDVKETATRKFNKKFM